MGDFYVSVDGSDYGDDSRENVQDETMGELDEQDIFRVGATVIARDRVELREIGIRPNMRGLVTAVRDDDCEVKWEKDGGADDITTNTPQEWLRQVELLNSTK